MKIKMQHSLDFMTSERFFFMKHEGTNNTNNNNTALQ